EGGVVVASKDPEFFELIRHFRWKELFWERRDELASNVRFVAFGHALYEKALDPYIGIVAKTVFVDGSTGSIDALLAAYFSERRNFTSPKCMAPMPVLGVPGWHPDTERAEFYDDPRHFRAKGALN